MPHPSPSAPPPAPDLAPLERVVGDLLVEEVLAETAAAVVYRVRTGGHGEPLALKVARHPGDAEELARFRHEVRLLSEAPHPHVVAVHDHGVLPGGQPYLAMELVSPRRVEEVLGEPPDWERFAELAMQAAAGLAHVHRQGIVHLDVKPANLGLAAGDGPPRLVLLDFGLARPGEGGVAGGAIRGTLAYAAPEVLVQDAYDHRADLYSLGLTLYQLATGELPSAGGDRAALAFHLAAERPDPRRARREMPEALATIVARLIARQPEERFATAGRLLAALGRATGRPVDPDALLPPGGLLSARLIGREATLDRLRRALAEAAGGRGRVVVVEGGEGMGKSRLLRELRLWAAVAGARVGAGRAAADGDRSLGPFFAAAAAAGVELPPPTARAAAGDAEGRERFRLYRDLARRLGEDAAGHPPLVLLLDDLHRGGRELAGLVDFLVAEAAELPLLVVGAREPGAEPGGGAAAEGEPEEPPVGPLVLPLPPFGRDDTARLVDASLGAEALPAALHDRVHAASGGVPGRVGPLLRSLVDRGVLRLRAGEWKPSLPALRRWSAAEEGTAEDARRLDHLAARERETLEAAAVLDEPFALGELAALLDAEADAAYERLAPLLSAGQVERVRDAGRTGYALADRRLRDGLVAALDAPRRSTLHRRRAADLERRGGADAARVAEHWWRAGERAAALPHLLAATRAAAAVFAHAEAARLAGRAVEAAAEAGGREAARAAGAAQAAALAGAGQSGRALQRYEELLADRDAAADAAFTARLALGKGNLHRRMGDADAARAAFRTGLAALAGSDAPADGEAARLEVALLAGEARTLAEAGETDAALAAARRALARAGELAARDETPQEPTPPPAGRDEPHHGLPGLDEQRARLLDALAMLRYDRGDFRVAERLERRALAAARRLGPAGEDLVLRLRNNLGNVRWKLGDHDAAEAAYRENLDHCRATHDPWGEARASNNLGVLAASRGDWRAARAPLAASLAITRRLGSRGEEAMARLNLAEVDEMLGDWPRARRQLERALAAGGEAGSPLRPALLARLASLARKRGEGTRAEELAGQALAAAGTAGDRDLAAECHHLLGLAAKDREDYPAAAESFARAAALAGEAGTRQVLARVRVSEADLALRRRDPAAAAEAAAAARALVAGLADRLADAKLLSVEARLAALAEDEEEASRLFAAAAREMETLATPYELGRVLYEWGLRTWNPELAQERLARALALFDRLGAEAEARRTRGVVERIAEHRGRGGAQDPVLYGVIKVVNSTLDLREVLDRAMDLALEHLEAERGMIVLHEPLTRELRIAVSRNLHGAGEAGALSESVVRRVIEEGAPVVAVDALTDRRFAGAESIVASSIRSILCVPLAIRDRPAGAIYVDHTRARHVFRQDDVDFLVAFADHAAVAIDKARLYGEQEAARRRLSEENEALRQEILASHHLGSLIGRSRAIEELKRTLERVAQSDSTVLLRGESGTGKGLVARIVHSVSPRRGGPFVQFNCAALPETLVESELFGHEKGAFTGAAQQKPGRFELAHGGTIFLDEIGKVSRAVQAKLLRVVEDKEFERVGGTRTLASDARILAATNLDLEEAIARDEFREDLYYRLNIIPVVLPPLRERREDLPYLTAHFLERIGRDLGQPPRDLDPDVLDLFAAYPWPGNVRELEATIHRALVLSTADRLTRADFPWIALRSSDPAAAARAAAAEAVVPDLAAGGYEEALASYDRRLIESALARSGGRLRETARLLGIARNTLKAKIDRYEIER